MGMEMMEIGVGKSGLAPPSSSTSSTSSASSSSSSSSPLASKSSRRRRQQPAAAAATVSFSSPSPFATEGNQAVQRLNVFSPIKKSKDSPRVAGIGMGNQKFVPAITPVTLPHHPNMIRIFSSAPLTSLRLSSPSHSSVPPNALCSTSGAVPQYRSDG